MSSVEEDVMAKTIKKSVKLKPNQTISNAVSTEDIATEPQTDFIHRLNLTDTTQQIEALKAIIFNSSDTNQTKIDFVKEELSANRYQINSDHIAEKLTEYTTYNTLVAQPEVA